MHNARRFSLVLAAGLAVALAAGCTSHRRPTTSPSQVMVVDSAASAKAVSESAKFLADGKDDKAREVLDKALKSDPNYGPLHNNLGIVGYRQGKLYDAAREFDQAIRLMPTIAEPRNNLGMVMERVGRFDDAVTCYTRAHDLQPDNAVYIGNLLRARVRRGDNDPAMHKLFEELLMKETRPEWQHWAQEQVTLLDVRNHALGVAPTTAPASAK